MIHALLIGINRYAPASKVSGLNGCVNDMHAFRDYLQATYADRLGTVKTLANSEATRENIITAFRENLTAKAQQGDTVLFFFAGHGSRENTPPELAEYEPEGKNETLVCYDSRLPGQHDLADRELGYLLDEVAQKGARVTVIMDCCHSGSGTRSLADVELGKARFTPADKRARSLTTYLDGDFTTANEVIKNPPHILLAGCDREEKAYELKNQRGHFSFQLLRILAENNGEISYSDLYEECRLRMKRLTDKQHPQFETYGFFNAFHTFLKNAGKDAEQDFRVSFADNKWRVNAGAVHHLPTDRNKSAVFEIYDKNKKIGTARTVSVLPAESVLDLDYADEKAVLRAKMISLPVPPVPVSFISDSPALVTQMQQATELFRPVHFAIKNDYAAANYVIHAKDKNTFLLLDNQTDRLLRRVEGDNYPMIFQDLLEHTEKATQWSKTLTLQNRETILNPAEVDLILTELDDDGKVQTKHQGENVALDLYDFNGIARQNIRFEARNRGAQKLYGILLYFSSRFGIHVLYNGNLPAGKSQILPDKQPNGKPLSVSLQAPQKFSEDKYLFLVSTEKVTDTQLRQQPFKRIGETVDYWQTRGEEIAPVTRSLDGFDEDPLHVVENDWFTKKMHVEMRLHAASVSRKDKKIADGILTIKGHDSFGGNLVLSAVAAGGRSTDGFGILADLAEKNGGELLSFAPRSRSVSDVNVLEINNIENKSDLAENPLVIEIDDAEAADSAVIPLTFDGTHVLPLGMSETDAAGKTVVKIHHIPAGDVTGRSVTGAVKMVFLKLAFKKETANLKWVQYTDAHVDTYSDGIAGKVDAAENILLCIHGIIGNTKTQAQFARTHYSETPTAGKFDLILTFDYENLHTPIETTAANLKTALENAGITKESGKKITILAHSMGGLVSRYFIEMLNGKTVVNHLIMAGTPNEGSQFGKIPNARDKFLTLFGFALNFIGEIPFAGKIVKVLDVTKKVTVTLEQMDWEDESNFLKNLQKAEDPGVPYTIIAGDLNAWLKDNPEAKKLKNKLMRLGGKMMYKRQKNDLAVSTASIKSVSSKRNPAPVKLDAVCHHMNYFTEGGVERGFD